jgi:hypothetical protein
MITQALVLRNISATWWQCGQVTFNAWTIFPPQTSLLFGMVLLAMTMSGGQMSISK